jgi:hypothetical protein
MRIIRRGARASALVASLVFVVAGSWGMVRARAGAQERYLFVWAGDQARASPDFLAVIDFDQDSARYGEVITTRQLPGPGRPATSRTMSGCRVTGRRSHSAVCSAS